MDIHDYNRMLEFSRQANEARKPFEERAMEIAKKIAGSECYVDDIVLRDEKVHFTYEWNRGPSDKEEGTFPVDWLFDPDWEARYKVAQEENRRRCEEMTKRREEEELRRREGEERKEYERLKAKFEGKKI